MQVIAIIKCSNTQYWFIMQELAHMLYIDWVMSLDSTIQTSRSSMVEWNNTKHIQEQQL